MQPLRHYATHGALPGTESDRIGLLLGIKSETPLDDISLADRVANGLHAAAADALSAAVGRASVVGSLIPEATLRRARKQGKPLSREMSERLYEVARVLDAVSRAYHGDEAKIRRFLTSPHPLLDGRTPMQTAQSSSSGTQAVIKLLHQAEAGFPI